MPHRKLFCLTQIVLVVLLYNEHGKKEGEL